MPLLRMDEKGNIVQTDARFNGAKGIGQTAEMVEQGNMYELSLEPNSDNAKIQRDQKALANLKAKAQQAKINKWAHNIAKRNKMEAKRKAILEKRFQAAKKKSYKDQLYKNMSFLNAHQKGGLPEKMSGVAGYGYSADGRQPVLSQASVDYQPILQANVAFGGDAEQWGNETGLGQHSNTDVHKIGLNGLGNLGAHGSEKQDAIVLQEGMSDLDNMNIQRFITNSWAFSLYHKDKSFVSKTIVVDQKLRDRINNLNNNTNHSVEMQKVVQQGWGYSLLDNGEGDVQVVKVAYHYGLPIFLPDSERNKYSKDYIAGYTPYGVSWGDNTHRPWEGDEYRNGGSDKKTFWNALRPVIEAAGREYAQHADEFGVWQGKDYTTGMKSRQKLSSGNGFWKKLFSNVSSNYNHPLLKQGLLK